MSGVRVIDVLVIPNGYHDGSILSMKELIRDQVRVRVTPAARIAAPHKRILRHVHQRWMHKQREFLKLQAQASEAGGVFQAASKFVQNTTGSLLLG